MSGDIVNSYLSTKFGTVSVDGSEKAFTDDGRTTEGLRTQSNRANNRCNVLM